MVTHSKMRRLAPFARYTFLGVLAILLALAAPGRAMAQARKIELDDFRRIVSVSSPEISPDGKSVVIIVSRVNWDEDRHDSQLVLVDIATGAQRPLTNIRKGLDLPQWSPSGDRLAFVAEAGEEKKAAAQIFVLPMNGGEPQQITSAPLGVEQYAWRPDGKDIAYVTSDEPLNKAEIEKHHDLLKSATTVTSLPPLPLLRTSGWSLPRVARRSVSPPALGACRRPQRIFHPPRCFRGRRTASRSASLAKLTRIGVISNKPLWRYWTLTAAKSTN